MIVLRHLTIFVIFLRTQIYLIIRFCDDDCDEGELLLRCLWLYKFVPAFSTKIIGSVK